MTPEQRDALFKIMSGQNSAEGTLFHIVTLIVTKMHDPIFAPISFEFAPTGTKGVKSDGTVYAWGSNTYGQLGDGTTTQRTTPITVPRKNGIRTEESAKVAPSARASLIVAASPRTAKAAPRKMIPSAAMNSATVKPIKVYPLKGGTCAVVGGGCGHADDHRFRMPNIPTIVADTSARRRSLARPARQPAR